MIPKGVKMKSNVMVVFEDTMQSIGICSINMSRQAPSQRDNETTSTLQNNDVHCGTTVSGSTIGFCRIYLGMSYLDYRKTIGVSSGMGTVCRLFRSTGVVVSSGHTPLSHPDCPGTKYKGGWAWAYSTRRVK
jgi:hypothetical protein